ncbi:MAG: hypothetical protein RLZZ282_1799 [Verrucomicrobiota bacterium]
MANLPPMTEEPATQKIPAPQPTMPSTAVLAVVAIVLLGLLIVMTQRKRSNKSQDHSAALTEIQAEANALQSELNRQRIAMGLRPLEGGSEPVEDIAKRLKKDADSLAALAESFQSMFAAKTTERLQSEQLRLSLVAESARLQAELQRARTDAKGIEDLRRDLTAMKSQRDALAAELAAIGKGTAQDELADLQRRFEETQRAKEFFEAKAKELETNR